MRYEQRTVRIGEWLGDVPDDWDYESFYKKHLGQNREYFERSVEAFKQADNALREGKEVWIEVSGGFSHKVYKCGLYDGWPFWTPRPCFSYKGPIPSEHVEEFYNVWYVRIK